MHFMWIPVALNYPKRGGAIGLGFGRGVPQEIQLLLVIAVTLMVGGSIYAKCSRTGFAKWANI